MSNTISLVKNNGDYYELTVIDANSNTVNLEGARAVFTITDPLGITTYVQKTSDHTEQIAFTDADGGKIKINIVPTDTINMILGQYRYNVNITMSDGTVYDVIVNAPLFLVAASAEPISTTELPDTISVDHNFGAADAFRYLAPNGTPIADAQIRLYKKSEYDDGNLDLAVGETLTDDQGRWLAPILVPPGETYIIYVTKPDAYGPDVTQIVV